jgi:hypothetical protein
MILHDMYSYTWEDTGNLNCLHALAQRTIKEMNNNMVLGILCARFVSSMSPDKQLHVGVGDSGTVGGATGAAVVELMEELWSQQQRGSDRLGVLLAGERLARRSTRSSCRQLSIRAVAGELGGGVQGDSRGAQRDIISLETIRREGGGLACHIGLSDHLIGASPNMTD